MENLPVYDFDLINGLYTDLIYNHNIEKHSHCFFEIAITLEGKYVNHFDSGDLTLDENTMVIIRPRDVHYITNLTAVYRDIYVPEKKMIQLCSAISPTLFEEIMSSSAPPHVKIDKDALAACESTAKRITEFRVEGSPEQIEPLCNILVLKALSAYFETKNSLFPKWMPQWLLEMVAKLNFSVEHNLPVDFSQTLSDVVKQSGYSHGHICREFKKYFNCTLVQYLNKQKMIYSTTLLLNNNLSVAEIAQMLGYSNQSNYITTFKSFYGESPNSWRKNKIKRA
jgi:AraC-like DNA-binding protein